MAWRQDGTNEWHWDAEDRELIRVWDHAFEDFVESWEPRRVEPGEPLIELGFANDDPVSFLAALTVCRSEQWRVSAVARDGFTSIRLGKRRAIKLQSYLRLRELAPSTIAVPVAATRQAPEPASVASHVTEVDPTPPSATPGGVGSMSRPTPHRRLHIPRALRSKLADPLVPPARSKRVGPLASRAEEDFYSAPPDPGPFLEIRFVEVDPAELEAVLTESRVRSRNGLIVDGPTVIVHVECRNAHAVLGRLAGRGIRPSEIVIPAGALLPGQLERIARATGFETTISVARPNRRP